MAWLLRLSRSSALLLCRPESEEPAGAFAVDDGRPGPPECRGADEVDEDDVEEEEEEVDEEELCPDDLLPPPAVCWSTEGSAVRSPRPNAATLPCRCSK